MNLKGLFLGKKTKQKKVRRVAPKAQIRLDDLRGASLRPKLCTPSLLSVSLTKQGGKDFRIPPPPTKEEWERLKKELSKEQ